ncbi:MAG TPA: methyltransferase domain-containing protein [Gemmatimonadaceae bacterium]|nr:methyltransferase domain-containing protein [Gemmatimonadaceae bacterium]
MKKSLLDILRSPVNGTHLSVENAATLGGDVVSGELVSARGDRYPIVDSIPRFVGEENYAQSFGLQWTHFRRTQLDSYSGLPISSRRFYTFTGWHPAELAGKRVLEVGCGSGRFTEVVLDAGARVVAVDYSRAVDACLANHSSRNNLDVVQADIYHLPFEANSFDFVFCFGVLQHTPDVHRAFSSLVPQLKAGGRLAVDVYPKLLRNLLWSKYWIRPVTKRMATQRLFQRVQRWTPRLLRVSRALSRVPLLGRGLRYSLPVVNYEGVYELSREQLEEWAILDTFDMLAPAFDQPQTEATVKHWFANAALEEVSVERIGFVVGRGRRPSRLT